MAKPQLSEIFETLREKWPCCQFGSVPTQTLPDREKGFFDSFMPQAVSAIAVGHHVVTEKEWTWYQPLQGHERCDADDHTFEVCIELVKTLDKQGVETRIVDYPGETGLQFRYVAEAADLGRIGNNAFLLHSKWGPWVHLRILATTVQIESNPYSEGIQEPICCDCGTCIESCPAGALKPGSFEGLTCRAFRKERGEYIPVGIERIYKWCMVCASVCPLGQEHEDI